MHISRGTFFQTAALVLLVVTTASHVSAQEPQALPLVAERDNRDAIKIRDWPLITHRKTRELRPELMRTSASASAQSLRFQPPKGPRNHNAAERALISAGMGVAGFFVGGYVGAQLEPPCRCDDPGLKGFIIGAPIGAAAGAIVGALLTR